MCLYQRGGARGLQVGLNGSIGWSKDGKLADLLDLLRQVVFL